MKKTSSIIIAATAFVGADASIANAKEFIEVRRAITVKGERQGRGVDDARTTTPDTRQGLGADDAVTTTPDTRQGRGADDAVPTTPDTRRGRGTDDAVPTTPYTRQGRGADDALTTTPDIRQGRGAGDAVTTASALSANAQNTARLRAREHRVAFGASKQASQTAGLTPRAIYRTNGTQHILDVMVAGYGWQEGMGSADLENGEIIGNLPNKQRLRFAVYANTQQAQAAAWVWAKPAPQETREDGALIAADTGIISWDAETVRPDDNSPDGIGSINGLFLTSERMPELSGSYLRGKVIQIYGPLVTAFDDAGNPASCTRQVYWTSAPLR